MELLSQVNTFVGGLNLDDDLTLIPKNQYRNAENIRLITNDAGTTGVLQNIESIRRYPGGLSSSEKILGTTVATIYNNDTAKAEECGVIITKETVNKRNINNVWTVTGFDSNEPKWNLIVSATLNLVENVSIVANYESKDLSKLYITDGNSNIKLINLAKRYNTEKNKPITNVYHFDILPETILFPTQLVDLTSGMLPAGSVQYCFQLFAEHGTESAISPISNVIPLSKDIKNGESKRVLGQIKGESSQLGCVLRVQFYNTGEFNRLRMFRIHYSDNISLPNVTVINEIEITTQKSLHIIQYTDNGAQFVNTLTLDEFSALVPYDFFAKNLVGFNNRLFAANVTENAWDVEYDARTYRCDKDGNVRLLSSTGQEISGGIKSIVQMKIPVEHDCINPYNICANDATETKYIYRPDGLMGGTGPNVSYKFIFAELVLSSTKTNNNETANDLDLNTTAANKKTIRLLYEDGTLAKSQQISSSNAVIHNYSNAYICANYLGYMRDELYRFGIVFYNKKGIPSPVHWIGDIRMPSTKDVDDINHVVYPFHTGKYSDAYNRVVEQMAYAMGIEFTVSNIPANTTAWEIVRCDRTEADRTVVSQGILSSLVEYGNMDGDYNNDDYSFGTNDIRPMPLFNLSREFWVRFLNVSASNTYNVRYPRAEGYFEFVSPEVCLSKGAILPSIQNSMLNSLYKVATYNSQYPEMRERTFNGILPIKQLSYKQKDVQVVRTQKTSVNDKWFGGICQIGSGSRYQLYFHGGSGPGYKSGEGGDFYEKQSLFKYYNVEKHKDINNYQIKDAIIGNILPYENNLNDSKNHAQSIGTKMYTNTSVAGYQEYGNHGTNCVLHVDESFNKTTGINGSITDVFNFLNSTYICNIKRNIIPYNGNTYISRQNSIYISCGAHQDSSVKNTICYGGDTYLNIFDYLNTSLCQKSSDLEEWVSLRMMSICYIPLESVVNTNLFSSKSYHNTVNGTSGDNLIQEQPIVLGNGYVQQKPLYEYNTAYSVQSEALRFIPKSIYAIDNLNSHTRIACSELKTNNELIDSWGKFKFANYLDIDSKYGKLTNLVVFKNKLYFFQDTAVGVASVNDRSLITDNNPGELVLGTGGILTRYDYILTKNGNSKSNDKSITTSENTMYWFDYDKNVICALTTNGFLELSKHKKVQTYFNDNYNKDKSDIMSFFEKKNGEVWFKLYGKSLVYNENVQAFTTFCTHNPSWAFNLSTKVVTVKNNSCYYLHDYYGNDDNRKESLICMVKFVVNDNPMQTKTFDNQWFSADLTDKEHADDPQLIKKIFFETKNQQTDTINYTNIEHREDNYRFAIGREKENTGIYAGRMRGKYLVCDYTFDCNDDKEFKLPYIKTTYRYSML